jgi:tripartite motif-containing protein 71
LKDLNRLMILFCVIIMLPVVSLAVIAQVADNQKPFAGPGDTPGLNTPVGQTYRLAVTLGTPRNAAGQMYRPAGIAVDAYGNVYVADTVNNRVEKFDANGNFQTTWGGSKAGNTISSIFSGGLLFHPDGVAVDASGNVYVADTNHHKIQKFTPDGNILAAWGEEGHKNGSLAYPEGVAVDARGNVYVTDRDNWRIQKFGPDGSFLAKWGKYGTNNSSFGGFIQGVAVDSLGNVYVTDTNNNRVQKFDPEGNYLMTLGKGADGLDHPKGVAVDSAGNVYVADTFNDRIRKFDADGNSLAKWGEWGAKNGQFKSPEGVAVDSIGNLYVADTLNDRVQKFDADGNFLAAWGSPRQDTFTFIGGVAVDPKDNVYVSDNSLLKIGHTRVQEFNPKGNYLRTYGKTCGNGSFNKTMGVAFDAKGNVYVVDPDQDNVKKFSQDGRLLTVLGQRGSGNGSFKNPRAIATDPQDNVYVTDSFNYRIQKFGPDGKFLTAWGKNGSAPGEFRDPAGVAIDSKGNIYVTDAGNINTKNFNSRVQKFGPDGKFLMTWGKNGSAPGEFYSPTGIAIDRHDNVYVADMNNARIQKFDTEGNFLTTIDVIRSPAAGSKDNSGLPFAVAVNSRGNVYVVNFFGDMVLIYAPV